MRLKQRKVLNTKIKIPAKALHENKILKKKLRESELKLGRILSGMNDSNEEFKKSESFYKSLIENGSDLISLWDKNGKLIWFSPSVKKILGYDTELFKGKKRIEFTHPEDIPILKNSLKQVLKKPGSSVKIAYRIRDIKGAWHLCEGIMTNLLHIPGVNGIISNLNDVTEERKSDVEQKLSEEKFENVLQNIRDVIYQLDIPNKKYIYVSPSTEYLFGIPAEKFLKNKLGVFKDRIHKDDRARVIAHINDIFTKKNHGKKEFLLEYRIVYNGEIKWIADSQTVFYDSGRNPKSLFGNISDITFRKIAQQELQNSYDLQKGYLKLLTSIQNSLPAEIALLDKSGVIIAVNEAWKKFARENALVHPTYQIGINYISVCESSKTKRTDESHDVAKGIQKVLDSEVKSFSCEYPCHSPAEERWFQLVVTPINEKRNEGAVVMHIDISERILAEKSVKESEKQYQALFYQSPIPMFIWNTKNCQFLAVNKAALKYYGYAEEDFLKLNFFDISPKRSNEKGFELNNYRVSKHRRKDGSIFNAEVTYVKIIFQGNLAALASVNDITEMLKYQETLKERNNEMSHLYKAGKELSSTLNAETIYNNSYKIITEIIPCDSIVISAYDRKNKIITCSAAWLKKKRIDSSKFPPLPLDESGKGVQSFVILSGESRIMNNFDAFSRKTKHNYYINKNGNYKRTAAPNDKIDESVMVVPMKLDGKVIGVIQVFSEKKNAYNEDNLRILEAISTQFSASTANALLYQQAQKEINEREKAELALKKKTEEITFLYETKKELASTLDTNIIYDKTYKIISKILPCDSMIISSYNKKDKLIKCISAWAEGKRVDVSGFPEVPLAPKGYGVQSRVILSCKSEVLTDYDLIERKKSYNYSVDKKGNILGKPDKKSLPNKSALIVPMTLEGEVIGIIQLLSTKENAYTPDQLNILEALSGQLSAATANALLYQQAQKEIEERQKAELALKKKTEEITFLYEVEKEISSTLDINIIYAKIYKVVTEIMSCDSLIISSFDKKEKLIRCMAVWADDTRLDVSGFRTIPLAPEGKGIQSRVIRTGNSELILDYEAAYNKTITKHVYTDSKKKNRNDSVYSSALVVPLKLEGNVIGVLQVLSYKKNAFAAGDLKILEALTALLSAATANAILYQQAQNEIEQRILTEEKLLKNREILENAQRISHLGSYEVDLKTNIVLWSDEMYNINGLKKTGEEVDFNLSMSIIPPEDRELAADKMKKLIISKGNNSYEMRLLRPDGEMRYVRTDNEAMLDETGKVTGIRGTMLDITERKKAEEKLRSSELHLLASQQIAKIGSWELNMSDTENINSNALVWSDEAYRIFGFQPGGIEVTNELFYSMVHPDDREIVDKAARDAINANTKYSVEHRIVLSSGEIKYVQEKSDMLYDAATGKPLKMIGTVQDITEQKSINTKLVQSLHEKELMLKEVHHRVKNNLQVVSSLLRIQAANVDDKRVGEYLKISEQRVQSMALIHQQLYKTEDLSRIDFGTYVRELCSYLFFAYGIDQSKIRLSVNIDNIYFGIDTALPCGLIINELVTNALKHAFPDGMGGNMYITLFKDDTGKNHLTIKDSGVGITGEFNPEKTKTLGMQLVSTLSRQLESELKITTDEGTNVELIFKDLTYKKRT